MKRKGKREVRKKGEERGWKGESEDRGRDRVEIHTGVRAQQISPLASFPGSSWKPVSFPGSSCKHGNEGGNQKLYLSHCLVSWPNCKSCLPFLGGWAVKTAWGQTKSRDMSYTPNTPLDVPMARHCMCVCGREKFKCTVEWKRA